MRDANQHFLESYHYVHKDAAVKKMRRDGVKVFLDSGAYSASTQGVKIDIGRFCDYIHKNRDIIEMVSVLDDINFADPKGAAKNTYHNLMEMKRRGVHDVLPCYHQGEPVEALEYYIENFDYITLGGLVGSSTKGLMRWLDYLFDKYLTNSDGTLKVKVHLFGVTSLPLMLRYNATSVDSSTWVQWAAMGMILLPYSGRQLNISSQSPFRKQKGQHLDSIRPVEREACEREIVECGADPQRLRDLYYARWAFNCWAFPKFLELRSMQKQDTFKATDPVLF